MYVVIWEFRVRQGADGAFTEFYGAAGGWAALLRTSATAEGAASTPIGP